MPLPSRQEELYGRVRDDLREKYPPGSALPTEPRYARLLGCGRTTLRKVLARLQEERLISRTRGGTVVLDPREDARPPEGLRRNERPVFLLLPCADYVDAIDRCSLALTRVFLAGAMRGAIESGSRLVTLPVSETNRDEQGECVDIAWSQVSLLRRDDRVLFLGRWFRRVVPRLVRARCRFTYISQLPGPFPEQERRNGLTGYSNLAFVSAALRTLAGAACGTGRVGCLWFSLEPREREAVEEGFRSLLASLGLDGVLEDAPFHSTADEKRQALRRLLRRGSPDTVVICPHLRDAPWAEEDAALLRGRTLVMEANDAIRRPPSDGPVWIGHDRLFETSRRLVKDLLAGPPRMEGLHPYEFEPMP